MDLLNLFSLHGKYFQNDENRFAATVLFLLSETRQSFLPEFLNRLNIVLAPRSSHRVRVRVQLPHFESRTLRIPDADIRLEDDFHVLLEAKVGMNPLDLDQLQDYAIHLSNSRAQNLRLVCITQADCFTINNRPASFEDLRSRIEPAILPVGTCQWLRWFQVLDLLKSCLQLTPETMKKNESRILKGKSVDYQKRLAELFLQEVENTMYDKKEIDLMPHGEVEDIVLATQDAWFMDVALRHRVWFPNNLGGRAARYVAHYETADRDNANPGTVTYIARNRTMWNRITIAEGMVVHELQHAFNDPKFRNKVKTWPKEDKHCIVLTDDPIRLRKVLPLGEKKYLARIMAGWYISITDLYNAQSLDDFQRTRIEPGAVNLGN